MNSVQKFNIQNNVTFENSITDLYHRVPRYETLWFYETNQDISWYMFIVYTINNLKLVQNITHLNDLEDPFMFYPLSKKKKNLGG